jgi:hypothetical protein
MKSIIFCRVAPSCAESVGSGSLIADNHGALYGTTSSGGTANSAGTAGVVFKLTPPAKGQTAWTETVLYRFCSQPNCSDGDDPIAGLIADNHGALYGTTVGGGSGCPGSFSIGCGTVFKLTSPAKGQTAWTETVLYRFCVQPNCSDGDKPIAGLIADNHSALYGTTAYDSMPQEHNGSPQGGTVFKLTPPAKGQTAWTETVLYRFCSQSNCSDGGNPMAGLIADNHGALYGTTTGGGSGCPGLGGCGTVFKLAWPQ